MSNKNELPADVQEQIKTNAALRCDRNEGKDDNSFRNGYYSGYVSGATEYATKLHAVEKERDELRQWKMEAVELQIPIIAYCHKHLEVNIGDSCTALVIAELDRLREENAALKAQPGDTFLLNRMGITLENIYRIHSVQWNEYDRSVIRGILDQWEKSKKDAGPGIDVFVPCAEEDPETCGSYTSHDGRSLCYVKVKHIPTAQLTQERADLIREANNRDMDGKGGMPKLDEPLISEQEFKAWEDGEKEGKPEPPAFEIKAGLKFKNVHMPGYTFAVVEVSGKYLDVSIVHDTEPNHRWMETEWIMEHTQWAFEKGEYFIEKEVKG